MNSRRAICSPSVSHRRAASPLGAAGAGQRLGAKRGEAVDGQPLVGVDLFGDRDEPVGRLAPAEQRRASPRR